MVRERYLLAVNLLGIWLRASAFVTVYNEYIICVFQGVVQRVAFIVTPTVHIIDIGCLLLSFKRSAFVELMNLRVLRNHHRLFFVQAMEE